MPLLTAGPSRFLGGGAKWWQVPGATCVAAYQPKGAADLAASYVNLANPGTYNAAPGVAPTLAAGGWSFDGVDDYLSSQVSALGTTSLAIRFVWTSPNKHFYGTSGSQTRFYTQSANGQSIAGYGSGTGVLGGTAFSSGIVAAAGAEYYQNGISQGTVSGTFTGTGGAIYIGALNNGGTAASFCAVTIAAVAIYSTVLSADDVAALTTRMQAL